MVTRNITRHRGVQVDDYFWGRLAKGTREMLIKHGFAQEGLFPGDVGAQKYRIDAKDPSGRSTSIERTSKYLFSIRRDWTGEEEAARKQKLEHDKEIEGAQRLVASWPKSATAYREEMLKTMGFSLRMMEILLTTGSAGGYRYDADTSLRFNLIADQLRKLIEVGPIIKDLALREQHTPACIAKAVLAVDAAKRDKQFQRFIADVKQ